MTVPACGGFGEEANLIEARMLHSDCHGLSIRREGHGVAIALKSMLAGAAWRVNGLWNSYCPAASNPQLRCRPDRFVP